MQKVKVHRYVSGKRPEYAPVSSSEEESEDELPFDRHTRQASPDQDDYTVRDDPRLRRLQQRDHDLEDRDVRQRHIHEPEVLATGDDEEQPEHRRRRRAEEEDSDEEEEEEIDEEEMEARRQLLRQRMRQREEAEKELLDVEEEGQEMSEQSEESEYEEYTDSEEETGPRLKPVFVRKKDRVTVQEREREVQRQKEIEQENKRALDDRRKNTLKLVEDDARKELADQRATGDPSDVVLTDDENDEVEYEAWKLRELKRIKRDRDEKDSAEKERAEIERLRSMTEEERRAELRANPKAITNKSVKGKYKFLQKYYHRGVFFMDGENDVLRRDFSQPTLEDHFDKTILPKVMQVKNFGRSGRTKYTHLVDQDTTQFDSPWVQETAQNLKFFANQAGGMKQDRPNPNKRKK